MEIKNSTVGKGTSVSHLTYVGDSDVGKYCNFGCGVVTVNYDGAAKHRNTIGIMRSSAAIRTWWRP